MADDRIENDCKRNQELERRLFELEAWGHECGESQTDSKTAENKIEDVAAAIGLGEMRREPVGPAIGPFQKVDWCRQVVGLRAPGAIALPFVADLRFGMVRGEIARTERANPGR